MLEERQLLASDVLNVDSLEFGEREVVGEVDFPNTLNYVTPFLDGEFGRGEGDYDYDYEGDYDYDYEYGGSDYDYGGGWYDYGGNSPPTIVQAIPDQFVQEDAAPIIVDLASVFHDADLDTGDRLAYRIGSNSNPQLASGTLEGAQLRLTVAPDQHGTGVIRVIAEDSSLEFVEEEFAFTVHPVNDSPIAESDSYHARARLCRSR